MMCLSRCSAITSQVVSRALTQCTFIKQEVPPVLYTCLHIHVGLTSLHGFIPDQTQIWNRAKLLSKDQMKFHFFLLPRMPMQLYVQTIRPSYKNYIKIVSISFKLLACDHRIDIVNRSTADCQNWCYIYCAHLCIRRIVLAALLAPH